MNKGKFYGIGVGPGDSSLMTLKAYRIINKTPVIAAPQAGGRMRALEIAGEEVDFSEKEILPLPFEMTKSDEVREAQRKAAAETIATHLNKGKDVAMLNLGDVSIYATAAYVCEHLKTMGYETEMVAGIPSFCATAAALGTPLTEANQPLHILPGIGEDFDIITSLKGTKVILKSGKQITQLLAHLKEHSISADIVENCGLPDERILHFPDDADQIGDLGYFTTIIL